jgi:hypothetical protein
MNKTTTEDSVVLEVRAAREAILKRFDYNVPAMLRDAQKRQHAQGARVVSFAPKQASRKKSA